MNRVRRILNLLPGEGLPAFLFFIYLTFILSLYIVQKSVRDALFLDQYGAMGLPYLYIGVALVIGIVVSIYLRLSTRVGQTTLITWTLLLFMANGLLLWWTSQYHWQPLSIIYYLWANTSGIILTAQVWTFATTILTTQQAQRMFPLMCSGGILGSTLGGMIASTGAKRLGTDNLILVPVLLLAGCILIVQLLGRLYRKSRRELALHCQPTATSSGVSEALKVTMGNRYLRLIASLLALSAIVTLIVDFQFKLVIQRAFQNRDALAAFFGSFYAYVGLLSFVIQFLAGSRIVQKYGLHMALLFLPMTLLGGTAALLAYPTMIWAGILLKGSDGIVRGSIDKSTIEMLYVPLPQSRKVQVKAVIDMLIQRFSDGVGGLLLLLMTHYLGFGLYGVGVLNIGLLTLWIWIARETRLEYQSALCEAVLTDKSSKSIRDRAA